MDMAQKRSGLVTSYLAALLLLVAVLLNAAPAPSLFIPWTAPRGEGSVTVTTNPATGLTGTFVIRGNTNGLPVLEVSNLVITTTITLPTNIVFFDLTVSNSLVLGTNQIYSLAKGTNVNFVTNGSVLTISGDLVPPLTNNGVNLVTVSRLNQNLVLVPTNASVGGQGIIISNQAPTILLVITNSNQRWSLKGSVNGSLNFRRLLTDGYGWEFGTNGSMVMYGMDSTSSGFPQPQYAFVWKTNDNLSFQDKFGWGPDGDLSLIRGVTWHWPLTNGVPNVFQGLVTTNGTNFFISQLLFQPASTNLSNWANLPTNLLAVSFRLNLQTNSLLVGSETNFNIFSSSNILVRATNVAGTNFVVFAVVGNLTNWEKLDTNIFTGLVFITSVQSNYFAVVGGRLMLTNDNLINWAKMSTNSLIAINSTDGFVPVRATSNSFTNSPWFVISKTRMAYGESVPFLWKSDPTDGNWESLAIGRNSLTNPALRSISIGEEALSQGGTTNMVAIGYQALGNLTNGFDGVALAFEAGENIGRMQRFVIIGSQAGWSLLNGSDNNTLVGYRAGYGQGGLSLGSYNTFIGSEAGAFFITNSFNTFVGALVGNRTNKITNSFALGYNAQATNYNEGVLGNVHTTAVRPGGSNTADLGTALFPWKGFYVTTNGGFLGTNHYTDDGTTMLRNGIPFAGTNTIFITNNFFIVQAFTTHTNSIVVGSETNFNLVESAYLKFYSTNVPGTNVIQFVVVGLQPGSENLTNWSSLPTNVIVLLANPTATIGLTAVNGSANTAMRSDAAPPLSQAIVPVWIGPHTWKSPTNNITALTVQATNGQSAVLSRWLDSLSNEVVGVYGGDAPAQTAAVIVTGYSNNSGHIRILSPVHTGLSTGTGLRLEPSVDATVGVPVRDSLPILWYGKVWDTDDLVSRTYMTYAKLEPVSGAQPSALLVFAPGIIGGVNLRALALSDTQDVLAGNTQTNAAGTTNFFYIAGLSGPPTGTPKYASSVYAPITIDVANNQLYFYSGGAWRTVSTNLGGGAGIAAGNSGAVQFNQTNGFAGTNRFVYDRTNEILTLLGAGAGTIKLTDTASGFSILKAGDTVMSNANWILPTNGMRGIHVGLVAGTNTSGGTNVQLKLLTIGTGLALSADGNTLNVSIPSPPPPEEGGGIALHTNLVLVGTGLATNWSFDTGSGLFVLADQDSVGTNRITHRIDWAQTASTTNVIGVSNWVNAVSNLVQAKQQGDAVLTNLVGTVGRNITNFVSLSTSNATSKPLSNSYTAGVLTMFGLEEGANVTITPNGSNLVIATSGGVGEANVNGESSVTNAFRFGLVNGKIGITNLLRSFQPAFGLVGTNEGTNISFAVDLNLISPKISYTNMVWVDLFGDDATAQINNPARPYKRIDLAASNTYLMRGVVINVGAGVFNERHIRMPTNSILRGVGWADNDLNNTGTIIVGGGGGIAGIPAIAPSDNCMIYDVKVINTNLGFFNDPIGINQNIAKDWECTNVFVQRVYMKGSEDCWHAVTTNACTIWFDQCIFESTWDTLATANRPGATPAHYSLATRSIIRSYGPDFSSTHSTSISPYYGRIELRDCDLITTNGAGLPSYTIFMTNDISLNNQSVILDNCRIFTKGAASSLDIYNPSNNFVLVRNMTTNRLTFEGSLTRSNLVAGNVIAGSGITISTDSSGFQTASLAINPNINGALLTNELRLSGIIAADVITANQDDYNPTGLGTASTVELRANGPVNITGLQTVGTDMLGRLLVLRNMTNTTITLVNRSTGSQLTNRFEMPEDYPLVPFSQVVLLYSATSNRWFRAGPSLTLNGAQFVAQGTTTNVLHGSVSGNPSWRSVDQNDFATSTGSGSVMFSNAPTARDMTLFGNNTAFNIGISNTVMTNAAVRAGSSASNAVVGGIIYWSTASFTNLNGASTMSNLANVIISGHTMTNNGDAIYGVWEFQMPNALANTNQFQIIFGSQTILDTGLLPASNCTVYAWTRIVRTGNTAQHAWAHLEWGPGGGVSFAYTNVNIELVQTNGIDTLLKMMGGARRVGAHTNNGFRVFYEPATR